MRGFIRLACMLWTGLLSVDGRAETPIRLEINMMDAGRSLVHVREVIPVHAGENLFAYPQWIPGEHGPNGPIDAVAGLFFRGGGRDMVWRRDLVDMYQFHVQVPPGLHEVEVRFDFLSVPGLLQRVNAMSYGGISGHLAMLEMCNFVIYPEGRPVREIPMALTLQLPAGWSFGTALEPVGGGPGAVPLAAHFKPVSVEQLVDSPIVMGDHCRKYPLAPEITPQHMLDVCADTDAGLQVQPALLEALSNTVRQAGRLFASYHYAHYDFVLALSKRIKGDSLEHHQSADYRVSSLDYADEDTRRTLGYLLPHEYLHSWCGKYRRPVGLATPDYKTPMQDDLLWVYEGLTQYYGWVVAARAGFTTPQDFVDRVTGVVSGMHGEQGRLWRNLQDTADASSILRGGDQAWYGWRRGQDYYNEGAVVWLLADVKIRQLTKGRKSLDDFAALFFGGGGNSGWKVVPYGFADVVRALDAVAPYDWSGFWQTHLQAHSADSLFRELEETGYRFEYREEMVPAEAEFLKKADMVDARASLGFFVGPKGEIPEVRYGSVGFAAGIGPGDRIKTINGEAYTSALLGKALREAKTGKEPIVLGTVREDEEVERRIDYHGGDRFPWLTREPQRPDLLMEISTPRLASGVKPAGVSRLRR